MPVTVREAGNEWVVEADGELIGTAKTKAEAQELADQSTTQRKWVASWRFSSQRVDAD